MVPAEGTFFAPCRFFNGRAGVLLNFFEYRDSAIRALQRGGPLDPLPRAFDEAPRTPSPSL